MYDSNVYCRVFEQLDLSGFRTLLCVQFLDKSRFWTLGFGQSLYIHIIKTYIHSYIIWNLIQLNWFQTWANLDGCGMRVLGIFDCLQQGSAQLHRVKRCWLIERLGVFKIIVVQKFVIFVVVDLHFDDRFVAGAALLILALFPFSVGRAYADIVNFLLETI